MPKETGRFISADGLLDTSSVIGTNFFAYCNNDPINRTDESGNLSVKNWIKIGIGAAALAGAILLTVATGGGTTAVAVGIAKIVVGVAISTATSAGISYLTNGKEGAIDGACNGFMFGGLSACAGAALKSITSPANGVDAYSNLRNRCNRENICKITEAITCSN